MTKQNIRNQILNKRENLTSKEALLLSNQVFTKLLPFFSHYNNFFIYHSFKNEVDTKQIIKFLLENNKNVFLPKIENGNMVAVKFNYNMQKNYYGIEEPCGEKIEIFNFVSIIPAIALDNQGNRIGFGKGYYDKFLKNNPCLKIALCYDFQLLKKIPFKKHDVKMDIIITPSKIIDCNLSLEKK